MRDQAAESVMCCMCQVAYAGQRPLDVWHDQIGDPTTAEAICDRLLLTLLLPAPDG